MTDFVFRTWNANGVLVFDTGDRLGRVLGMWYVDGTAGSISPEGLDAGESFAVFFPETWTPFTARCIVSISGLTINWRFKGYGNFAASNPKGWIIYGVR